MRRFTEVDGSTGDGRVAARVHCQARPLVATIAAVLLAAVPATGVGAQSTGAIVGKITTTKPARPIAGARILAVDGRVLAVTDSAGGFRIVSAAAGALELQIQAVGYEPLWAPITVSANDTTTHRFALTQLAQELTAAEVRAAAPVAPKIREFEERRQFGQGRFITEDDLKKHFSRRLSEIIATIPGPRVIRGTSNAGWIASSRGSGSVYNSGSTGSEMDKRQGAPKACYATVMLDGNYVYSGRPGESLFDVNSIEPSQVSGIEFYAGAATVPMKFRGGNTACGLLLIWTK